MASKKIKGIIVDPHFDKEIFRVGRPILITAIEEELTDELKNRLVLSHLTRAEKWKEGIVGIISDSDQEDIVVTLMSGD